MNLKGTKLGLKGAFGIGFFLGTWGLIAAIYSLVEGEGEPFAIILGYSLMMSMFPIVALVGAYASSNLGMTRTDALGSAVMSSVIGNVLAQFIGFLVLIVGTLDDFSASDLADVILSVSSLVLSLCAGLLAGVFRILVTEYEDQDEYEEEEEAEIIGPDLTDTTKRLLSQVIGVEQRLTQVESTVKSERFTKILYGQQ